VKNKLILTKGFLGRAFLGSFPKENGVFSQADYFFIWENA
jgi:hypothetical protein